MKGEVNIRLTNRAIFVVLGAFLFIWLLRQATHIFVVLFIAVLLASSVSLAATWLERLHIKRGIAILLVYLVVLAILVGIVALLVPLIGGEIKTLRDNLPSYQANVNGFLGRLPKRNGETLRVNTLFGNLGGQLNGAAAKVGRGALAAGSALVTILLIFVIAFFLAVDPKFPERVVTRFVPPASRRRASGLMGKIGTGLGYWVRAQLLLALFFGVTFGLGLALLRMPYALTLGTIGAVLEIIPYVGGYNRKTLAGCRRARLVRGGCQPRSAYRRAETGRGDRRPQSARRRPRPLSRRGSAGHPRRALSSATCGNRASITRRVLDVQRNGRQSTDGDRDKSAASAGRGRADTR